MKKKGVAFVLAFFLGLWGVHRFYLGQRKLGLLYIFGFIFGVIHFANVSYWWDAPPLFVVPAVVGFIDSILFLAMPKSEFDEKFNKGNTKYASVPTYEKKQAKGRTFRKSTRQRQQTFKSANPFKISGLSKYKEYDYEGAVEDFKRSLDIKYEDPAVHFNLGCCYSILEETDNAFFHLDKAVEFGFDDFERIKNHDALAFIRTKDEFEQFALNGFRKVAQIEEPHEDLLSTPTPLMDGDILEKNSQSW